MGYKRDGDTKNQRSVSLRPAWKAGQEGIKIMGTWKDKQPLTPEEHLLLAKKLEFQPRYPVL